MFVRFSPWKSCSYFSPFPSVLFGGKESPMLQPLMVEDLQKVYEILLHERFVFLPHLFIQLLTYQNRLVDIESFFFSFK